MLPKDRQQINKLQKRNAILVIIILFLMYWILQYHYNNQYLIYENKEYTNQLLLKDKIIDSLKKSVKIEKPIVNIIPEKVIIKTKQIKERKKEIINIDKKDTNKTVIQENTPIVQDTTN